MEEGKVKLDAEVEAGLEGKEEEMEKSGMQGHTLSEET